MEANPKQKDLREVEICFMLLTILEKHVILWLWVFSPFLSGHLTILFHAPGIQKQKAVALDVDPFYLFWQVIYPGSSQLEYDWKLVGRALVLWF